MTVHLQDDLSRRDLCRLSLSTAAFLALGGATLSLAGCGGGGGTEPEPETRVVRGAVSRSELGAGDLKIVSAHAEAPAAVATDGAFGVPASADNAQLLIATGADGRLRGYGLSLPGEPVEVSATSTAVMMILLSPGLASSNVDDARSAVARINAQPRFPELVAAVRTRMAAGTLADFATDVTLESLRETLILGAANAARDRGTAATNTAIDFKVAWGKPVAKDVQRLDITHGGARFVRVDLQRRDFAGKTISTELAKDVNGKELKSISGGTFASVGSLLTLTVLSPSTTTAAVNLAQPAGTGRLKVYASGIGVGPGGENPPKPLGLGDLKDVYGQTVVLIFLFPIIDIVTGGLGLLKNTGKLIELAGLVWAKLGSGISAKGVYDAVQAGDLRGLLSSILDMTVALLGLGGALVGVLGIGGATGAAAAATLALVTAAVLIPITVVNLSVARDYLRKVPPTQSVELQVSAADVVVK